MLDILCGKQIVYELKCRGRDGCRYFLCNKEGSNTDYCELSHSYSASACAAAVADKCSYADDKDLTYQEQNRKNCHFKLLYRLNLVIHQFTVYHICIQ